MNYHDSPKSSKELDALYNEGYFHGVGSGYPKEGYEITHADWSAWLKLISEYIKPPKMRIQWLDLGCAYGFLLQQAQVFPIDLFGIDISQYALQSGKSILPHPQRERLLRGMSEQLPFRDQTFDVVSLFDVIEHIPNAPLALAEAVRVLKPAGVLLLNTPDPIYFDRQEETHFSERPPSYWVSQLQQLGFDTSLRFGNQFYEIELMAVRGEAEWKNPLQQAFAQSNHPVSRKIHGNSPTVQVIPRQWHDANGIHGGECLYLINMGSLPCQLNIEITTKTETHPNLFLNDLKLTYRSVDHHESGYHHHWEKVLVKPGGQSLRFIATQTIEFLSINIKTNTISEKAYLLELPFDHYQRYHLIAQVLNKIKSEPLTVLDVGGALGDMELFCPRHQVTILDRVWEDTPVSLAYQGEGLPFADASFDWVVAVDTLEHVPTEQREPFLAELARVSKEMVIVCGPYDEPYVAEAENVLQEYLRLRFNRQDQFLQEHETFSLPSKAQTRALFEYNGFQVHELPNGFLPRWLAMQLATFSLTTVPEQHHARAQVNALYNSQLTAFDNQDPAYRYLLLAARNPLSVNHVHELLTLVNRDPVPSSQASLWSLSSLIVSLTQSQIIQNKDQDLLHQANRVDQFLTHLNNLNQLLQQEIEQRNQLMNHTNNLEHLLQQAYQHNSNLQSHIQQLDSHTKQLETEIKNHAQYQDTLRQYFQQELDTRNKQIEQMQQHISHLEQQHEGWLDHINNLEKLITEQQQQHENLELHATNLQHSVSEQQKHNQNLEQLLQSTQQAHHQLQLKWQSLLNALNVSVQPDQQAEFDQAQIVIAQLHERVRELYESPAYKVMSKINLMPKPKTVHNENSSSHT